MLNNLTNFFNLIATRKVKTTLDNKDLLAIGTPDARFGGGYQPTVITYEDLEAQIAAGVTPIPPTLQAVVNTGSSISNFGGIGTASISSINFVNNRSLYLNNNANPTIRIVDNLNASNNLQIDIDTLTLDGVSYNWSSIVSQGLPAWVETNATDKTIWCNGQNNVSTNTSYGEGALKTASPFTSNNTAIGRNALSSVVMGGSCTALGSEALKINQSSNNTAVGSLALQFNTSGGQNTAIGESALLSNTAGVENVAVGRNALSANTIGGTNTAVGGSTSSGNFNASTILGYGATATGNNQFVVGSSSFPAGTVTNAVAVQSHYWTVKINGTDYKILLST